MSAVIKLLGVEVNCNTTPSNFGGARLVRLLNTDTAAQPVAIRIAAGTGANLFTVSIGPGESITLQKESLQTLLSANDTVIKGVGVAFSN